MAETLTAADIAAHTALGIDASLLEQAAQRVDDTEARQLLQCNGRPGRLDGIVYAYRNPVHGNPVTWRVRRDYPDLENGKTKNKYLSAAGDRRHVYFAPNTLPLLSDAAAPVIVAEAEKSVLAVTSSATRTGRRVLAIGTGGCWGWRGRIGKAEAADGTRVDELGPLPDLDLITWTERDTVIVFDSNAASNAQVQAARRALAQELKSRGARVRIVELPGDGGINGPDDYIGRHGDAAFFTLIDAATAADTGVRLEDFHAYMPAHAYIFAPSRELWPASSVNASLPVISVMDASGTAKAVKPAAWLDLHRAVQQMTWAPGLPMEVRDRLVSEGGWIDRPGCTTFNLYRPPARQPGDPHQAQRWIDHVRHVYPHNADHLIAWLAHRVQRPGEKINHALVLGGLQGVGKDTLLEPVKDAIGAWNFTEVSPGHLLGRFNSFVKSVILRISEARDLGDVDRYAFYDHLKTYTAAPPDVLRCDEKHLREHAVQNVCGVIITTNHKTDGLYLPADDRRHYVAWSELTKEDFLDSYWTDLWRWYEHGGRHHVGAFLDTYDLSTFNPKAPPPKTPAFYDIVDANRAPEDAELADALDALGNPDALTLQDVARVAAVPFAEWLQDRKSARQVPHRMETANYVRVRNEAARDGLWSINGRRQTIYARQALSIRDRIAAAQEVAR